MDMQYFGGNCLVLSSKGSRIVIDDTLAQLGAKSITKQGDVVLFTGPHNDVSVETRLLVEGPGEYESQDLSIIGVAARGHMDEPGTKKMTIYKVITNDVSYLFVGHVYPELDDQQLETIGMVDVMCVPVGGNGYTLDAHGALQLIKHIEPKLVVPTHYADQALHYPVPQQDLEHVLKELGMEVRETTAKFRLKPGEITSTTQLEILSRS
jgi:L-ascorbate metabolism protein UlaG (beta-lactamase superfamily)